ncbi:hypothetical protein ACFLT5_00100 [Chloroflexota bacterium]
MTLCSQVTERAKQSMLRRFPIHEIPSGLDTEALAPLDPWECRSILGIPRDTRVIMPAALFLTNYRKGEDLLLEALESLPPSLRAETMLLLMGSRGEALARASGEHIGKAPIQADTPEEHTGRAPVQAGTLGKHQDRRAGRDPRNTRGQVGGSPGRPVAAGRGRVAMERMPSQPHLQEILLPNLERELPHNR